MSAALVAPPGTLVRALAARAEEKERKNFIRFPCLFSASKEKPDSEKKNSFFLSLSLFDHANPLFFSSLFVSFVHKFVERTKHHGKKGEEKEKKAHH